SLRQIIEESSEYLTFVDGRGRMREINWAARAFLRLDSGSTEEIRLEDLFVPASRDRVAGWGERVIQPDAGRGSGLERPVTPVEATLTTGAVVRLHLRSTVEACGNETRRWLIHFEDHGLRKAQLEAEGRLETEMVGLMDSIDSGVLLLDAAGK